MIGRTSLGVGRRAAWLIGLYPGARSLPDEEGRRDALDTSEPAALRRCCPEWSASACCSPVVARARSSSDGEHRCRGPRRQRGAGRRGRILKLRNVVVVFNGRTVTPPGDDAPLEMALFNDTGEAVTVRISSAGAAGCAAGRPGRDAVAYAGRAVAVRRPRRQPVGLGVAVGVALGVAGGSPSASPRRVGGAPSATPAAGPATDPDSGERLRAAEHDRAAGTSSSSACARPRLGRLGAADLRLRTASSSRWRSTWPCR